MERFHELTCWVHLASLSEVAHFDHPVAVQKNIVKLDIAMHESQPMYISKHLHHLQEDLASFRLDKTLLWLLAHMT